MKQTADHGFGHEKRQRQKYNIFELISTFAVPLWSRHIKKKRHEIKKTNTCVLRSCSVCDWLTLWLAMMQTWNQDEDSWFHFLIFAFTSFHSRSHCGHASYVYSHTAAAPYFLLSQSTTNCELQSIKEEVFHRLFFGHLVATGYCSCRVAKKSWIQHWW